MHFLSIYMRILKISQLNLKFRPTEKYSNLNKLINSSLNYQQKKTKSMFTQQRSTNEKSTTLDDIYETIIGTIRD